jgi:amino acid transporter
MLSKTKDLFLGSPLPTQQLASERLNKIRALAVFSPGALSSIAYANQEIYLGLIVAGSIGLSLSFPIALSITGLLAILTLSYFQTIFGYPTGGGSYAVARENLGSLAGLLAAAALLADYLLTAAVSFTASVEAIASAFPALWPHRVSLALLLLLLVTLINLRGVRESGTLLSIPVYAFLIPYLMMLAYGILKGFLGNPSVLPVSPRPAIQPLTAFLVIHAFSTGCTAMTGIEAISNGVPAFKKPEPRNAGITLIVMAFLMGVLFLGSIGLTQFLGVVAGPQETILSALARRLLGDGLPYLIIQFTTMLILAVAANTSFAGFPRLAAILAADGYLPRQLSGLGDRLVYTNGILLLAGGTAGLILIFNGSSHLLIPLFAIGAFLAYSLSQLGMVRYWQRVRGRWWHTKSAINGLGALATGITLLIVAFSKFVEGAWITILLIPIMALVFSKIHVHYQDVAGELSLRGLPPSLKSLPPLRVVVPISGIHRGTIDAINLTRSIADDITAVYVELDPGTGLKISERWQRWWPDIPLVVLPSPYRSIIGPLLDFLDETDRQHNDGQLAAIVLPELVPAKWWQSLLHNQTAWLLRAALLYRRRRLGYQRVIINLPYHLKR